MDKEFYEVLNRAIRPQLSQWWHKRGYWLVTCLVLAYAISLAIMLAISYRIPGVPPGPIGLSFLHDQFGVVLLGITWLLLIIQSNRSISAVLDEQATPEPDNLLRIRFRIAYRQGLPLLLLAFCLSLVFDVALRLHSPFFGGQAGDPVMVLLAEAIQNRLDYYLPWALSMIWLAGLVALRPRRPSLAWILLGAALLAGLFAGSQFWGPFWGPYAMHSARQPEFWWVLGIAAMLGLFFALRTGKARLAQCLVYFISGSLLISGFPGMLYQHAGPLPPLLYSLTAAITCPYTLLPLAPDVLFDVINLLLPYGSSGTIQPYISSLIELVWLPVWICGVYALMYYVILRPKRDPGSSDS